MPRTIRWKPAALVISPPQARVTKVTADHELANGKCMHYGIPDCVSPCPALKSVAVSVPSPPTKASAPRSPVSVSLPSFAIEDVAAVAADQGVIAVPASVQHSRLRAGGRRANGVIAIATKNQLEATGGSADIEIIDEVSDAAREDEVQGIERARATQHLGRYRSGRRHPQRCCRCHLRRQTYRHR